MPQRRFVGIDLHVAESALGIGQRALQKFEEVILGERAQLENLRARDQRGIDEEKGIVRGGADQTNHAALHVRQEDVLLRLVEAVDFVDEKNGGLALVFETVGGGGKHAAHVGDI